jgi:hypothetical protein
MRRVTPIAPISRGPVGGEPIRPGSVLARAERCDGMLAVVTKVANCCAPYRTYLEWTGMGPRPLNLPPWESYSLEQAHAAHADMTALVDARLASMTPQSSR